MNSDTNSDMFKNSVEIPAEDEWTMDFYEFSHNRLNMLKFSLERLKQRQELSQGPLAPPPPLEQGKDCDLCERENSFLTSHPEPEIQIHYEDLRDKRKHEDYPCCKRRTAELFRRYYTVADCLPLGRYHIPSACGVTPEIQHQEEEIATNNQNLKALEDHNNYCQNVGPVRASDDTGDTVYDSAFDYFNPLNAVNPYWINPKISWGFPNDASSGCVSPNDTSSVPLIPDDTSSVLLIPDDTPSDIVPKSGKGRDSGYTTPQTSPVHGDSVQLESTLNTHVVLPGSPNIKGCIRNRQSVDSVVPAVSLDYTGSNPKSVPSSVLAGRNFPKNRKSQAKDDPALTKKGPKKGKGRRVPVGGEEEKKRIERNKQKALKEKQRRDKSKNLLDDVRAFLRRSFPEVLGQKAPHQRVIDTLIQLIPAVEFQEKCAKKTLLKARKFLREKNVC